MNNKIVFLAVVLIFTFFTHVESKENDESGNFRTYLSLISEEKKAVRLYKKGKYKKAYGLFRETGFTWGLKDSQYYLAFMYLKGQYVDQDIIMGLGLLGVANEAPIKSRLDLFEEIYSKLSQTQKTEVDEKIEELTLQIGVDAKNIKCVETQEVGSRRPLIRCDFYMRSIDGADESDIE